MGKYFGTDGFRGEAGVTLTADHAYKVGRFLGWYYNMIRERNGNTDPARIVIGKDTRRSSYMFEYSLVAGLTASGADAYLLHVTTTPSVAYIARVDDFDCGIMISASHNPYYDNGIKLIDCYGEKMPEETLLLVEDYLDGKLHVFDKDWPELPFAHREHIGCTVDYVSGRNRYMGYLISLGIYSFKGIKVGLDCANGSSWTIAKSVFDALGADTYVINAQPNGLNINNNAGSTHIEGLQKFVVENHLDIGFAYDGDADRCLCVDEKGNVITGDHILYIYGCYMKERGKLLNNTVVTTVMSNFGLYKAFDELGIGYAKTAVGDKYVYEYMAKNGCRIGGEQSGHIIFSKYASTGDGILTSLKMMEVMLAKKMPMSKLAEPLTIYPQVLENVRVTDKKAAQNAPAVQEAVKAVAAALGDHGRLFDFEQIDRVADVIRQLHETGAEIAIVIGAGNIWRGRQGPAAKMTAVNADHMGMLGTAINSIAMQDAVERQGIASRVRSAVEMTRFCEPYTYRRAGRHLEKGRVVIFACGTGNPFFSTDTAAALRAVEIGADAILLAKNVDGVYDSDPRVNPEAKLLRDITYQEVQERDLKVMDASAITICRENKVPCIRVFGLDDPQNILRVIEGDMMGTVVHP